MMMRDGRRTGDSNFGSVISLLVAEKTALLGSWGIEATASPRSNLFSKLVSERDKGYFRRLLGR